MATDPQPGSTSAMPRRALRWRYHSAVQVARALNALAGDHPTPSQSASRDETGPPLASISRITGRSAPAFPDSVQGAATGSER